MNVNEISMDRDQAHAKYIACLEENHADSYEFNQACATAYDYLAQGKRLLRLSHSIRSAGLNDKGLPRLAVARADRKEVFFHWREGNSIARFCTAADIGPWNARRWPELNIHVDMNLIHDDRGVRWPYGRQGYALVPGVPADVRPETGQLKDWFILWEVDEWAASPRFPRAPHDPFLLEHIGGDLYAILAEWDLTEVERAILEDLNN